MYICIVYNALCMFVYMYIYMLRIVKTQLPFLVTFDLVLHLDQVRNDFLFPFFFNSVFPF